MNFFKFVLPIALLTSVAASSELHDAVMDGNAELCKTLLGNSKRKRGKTLLGKGANVNARDALGKTPLILSIKNNRKECFDCILEHENVEVNLANYGKTALYFAARNGNEEMCGALLEKGADVNAQEDYFKWTPLMTAIYFGNNKCARMILRKYPKLEIQSKLGKTALYFAAWNANEEMCGALLEKGADVNAQNDDGKTPLMKAIYNRNNKCAKMILRKFPNLEIQNAGGQTALHVAAHNGNEEMVGALLAEGVNVNAQDKWREIPLMEAIRNGNNKCAKIILRKCPKLEVQNDDNDDYKTALDFARKTENGEMIAILEIAEKNGIEEALGRLAWEERENFLRIYKIVNGIGKKKEGATIYQIKM